jgi:hypothetical protein
MKNVINILGSALLATGMTVSVMAAPALARRQAPDVQKPSISGTSNISSVTCKLNQVSLGSYSATACEGSVTGNDTGSQGTLLDKLNEGLFKEQIGFDVTWTLAGKSDDKSNDFLTADNGKNTGNWSLKNALSTDTFVLSLKSGTSYSAYLFTGIDFSIADNLKGVFNTIGVALDGSGEAGKDLSHASLFVANKALVEAPTKRRVPEPSTIVGLGLAIGGIVITRRRKSN